MSKQREKTKKDDLESRFRKMEVHLAYLTGAATVLITAVLVFLGATSWYTIPTAVENQISSKVNKETLNKLKEAEKKAETILEAGKLQDKVKILDESVSDLKEDVNKSIEQSSGSLQGNIDSIDNSVSKLQKEVKEINEARSCNNPVKECVCKLDRGTNQAKLVVCVSRCPDGRLKGIEIKEIASSTENLPSCGSYKSKRSW